MINIVITSFISSVNTQTYRHLTLITYPSHAEREHPSFVSLRFDATEAILIFTKYSLYVIISHPDRISPESKLTMLLANLNAELHADSLLSIVR